jgi:hypothetical protein
MRIFISFLLLLLSLTLSAQTWTARQGVSMTGGTNGFYEYLPSSYNGINKLPVIIYAHGLGEVGNGTTQLVNLTNNAIPMMINNYGFPYQAIVIAPQFSSPWPGAFTINNIINYVRTNYSVDTNKIYLTGLSMGGGSIMDWGEVGDIYKIAAMAPLCPASVWQPSIGNRYKYYGMPFWFFHGDADGIVAYSNSTGWVSNLNASPSIVPTANLTTLSGYGHNIWNDVYDYSYNIGNGQNVYQWLLSQSRAGSGNVPPTANAGSNQTITLPTSSITVNGSGSDPDGTVASYAWTKVSGPAGQTIVSPSTASTSITGLVAGTYIFRLTVTDNGGATGTSDVTITVNAAANQNPTVSAGADLLITLPTSQVTLTSSASDLDGTIAGYSWTKISGPSSGTITTPSASSSTVTGLTAGTYVYRITVVDNSNGSAFDEVQVIVNQPPTVSAGSNQTIQLPTNSVNLTSTASDPDGTIASYLWTRTSGTGSTITSPSSSATTVTGLTQGTYTYRVTVTDNRGATIFSEITITVNAANINPVANAGTDQGIQLPINSVSLSGSGTDADGTVISYSWSKVSGPASGSITSPGSASTTVTGLQQGTYVFRLTVTDNQSGVGTDDVTVIVSASNILPTVDAGSDKVITTPANSVTLTGSAADADGTISLYVWTKISGPSGETITTPAGSSTTVTGLQPGTYIFRLTVTDNQSGTANDQVQVFVNQPPLVSAGNPQTIVLPTNTATLSGTSNDVDGVINSYSWSKVSGPTCTITSPTSQSTTVTGLTQGVFVFRHTVTDNSGASSSSDVTITVDPVPNQLPNANAGNPILINTPSSQVTLNGNATDSDGTISSYLWSKLSGGSGTITVPNNPSTTVTGLSVGVYTFRLIVTDNSGGKDTSDVEVTVNSTPVANAGTNKIVNLPTNTTTLNGSGTDTDGTIATYAWVKVSGPTGGSITSPTTASTNITGLIAGNYIYRLTINDDKGASNTSDVTVTVNAVPNQLPSANAGSNQTIVLPTNSVSLVGTASDNDGTVASTVWTKFSGPSASISSSSTLSTSVINLVEGIYVFRLTVTDNLGGIATSDVTITVNSPINQLPIVNAGSNQNITLPLNNITLSGTASDPDGIISTYNWTKVSGGAAIIQTPDLQSTSITGLVAGTYIFRLTVTDNAGASVSDDIQVIVNPQIINTAPTVTAGSDRQIKYPTRRVTLSGGASDVDGTIAAYSWTKVSGPSANIQSPNTAGTVVSNLFVGTYLFRLTAVDNLGGSSFDDVQVNVTSDTIYITDVKKRYSFSNGRSRLIASIYYADRTIQYISVKPGSVNIFLRDLRSGREIISGKNRLTAIITYVDNTVETIKFKVVQ